MRGLPNTNDLSNTDNWDYGPFQLNKYWTTWAVGRYNRSRGKLGVSSKDLSDSDIFGRANANEGFSGDVVSNGRMAARILLANGTNDRQRAMNYTSAANQRVRRISYDNYSRLFERFFNCYRGGDSQGNWR